MCFLQAVISFRASHTPQPPVATGARYVRDSSVAWRCVVRAQVRSTPACTAASRFSRNLPKGWRCCRRQS
eukprot:6186786-Pleurochrysis_carterae.AAC.1